MSRTHLLAAGLGLTAALAACERESEPLLCDEVAAGALVISEVRGGYEVADAAGQWVELYNASDAPIDLRGLAVDLETRGGDLDRALLRRTHTVAAGGYAVIGRFADDAPPDHVDVGWGTVVAIAERGAVTVACGAAIDRFAYGADAANAPPPPDRPLDPPLPDPRPHEDTNPPSQPPEPRHGTYALGLDPPDALGNDDASNWCVDGTETLGPCSGSTCLEFYQGSPGEPNPACPP